MCGSTNHQTVASFPGNERIYEYSIKVKTNPNYSEESDAERHLREKKKKSGCCDVLEELDFARW